MNQPLALEILLAGHNAFLTGAAGAGKTHTLNEFVRIAKSQGKKIAITATTGIAATHLGGNTIHAWSGIGVLDSLPRFFFEKMSKNRREQITRADILIIDEISMLHDFRLDLVEEICRIVRMESAGNDLKKLEKLDAPFGGLQVVFSGDFFQLPPITRREDSDARGFESRGRLFQRGKAERNSPVTTGGMSVPSGQNPEKERLSQTEFAYNAKSWQDANPIILYLDSQHRQSDDEFLDILNKIRQNNVTRVDAEKIAARYNANLDDTQEITELHTTNRDVDSINDRKMNALPGDFIEYEMTHTGSANYADRLKKSCLAPEILRLKKGALVMALKNDPEQGFVNGSIGTITDFAEPFGNPIVQFRSGQKISVSEVSWELRDGDKKQASITQIPLRPAYAITVHKSQGMTLDAAKINLKNVFEPGMGYVALSRVRSLDSLSILGLHSNAFFIHPEVYQKDQEFQKLSRDAETKFADLLKNQKKRAEQEKKRAQDSSAGARNDKSKKPANPNSDFAQRQAKDRETWPNAWTKWQESDDAIILKNWPKKDVKWLESKLGRSPKSVILRVEKLLGESAVDDKIWQKYGVKRLAKKAAPK